MGIEPREPCRRPDLRETLSRYCFGESGEREREAMALHLVECDACWEAFKVLGSSVRAIREDPFLTPVRDITELTSVLGLSGRVEQPFGGHALFAVAAAAMYGLLFAASVWTELGYAYGRFGGLAWALTLPTAAWMAGALGVSMHLAHRRVLHGSPSSLSWSGGIVIAAALAVAAAMFAMMPTEPTITATFQTRSASGGYFKNVTQYFLPLLFFVLPTFQFVVALQRELRAGRHAEVLGLLSGERKAVAPRGTLHVRPWMLGAGLGLAFVINVLGTNKMLDSILPAPHAYVYVAALYARVALWFAVAILGFFWYQRSLNELKREARAVVELAVATGARPHAPD